jgi:single-strand DNA-binding protein
MKAVTGASHPSASPVGKSFVTTAGQLNVSTPSTARGKTMAWDAGGHIIGRISNEPRLKTLATGFIVANFTVVATPRHFDRDAGEFREVTPVRIRCNAHGELGRHVVESLQKGDRVYVVGRLKNNDYTDAQGVVRELLELDVDAVGPDLRYATVTVDE